jgi:hypothetical protein
MKAELTKASPSLAAKVSRVFVRSGMALKRRTLYFDHGPLSVMYELYGRWDDIVIFRGASKVGRLGFGKFMSANKRRKPTYVGMKMG